MKDFFISVIFLIVFKTSSRSQNLLDIQLITHIEQTIKTQYKDWVAFSNGTYVVITADTFTYNLKNRAIDILKKFGNENGKIIGDSNFVISIKDVNGWVVDGPVEGLYTYVNIEELKIKATDNDIIFIALSKRRKDVSNPRIIFGTQ